MEESGLRIEDILFISDLNNAFLSLGWHENTENLSNGLVKLVENVHSTIKKLEGLKVDDIPILRLEQNLETRKQQYEDLKYLKQAVSRSEDLTS